MKGIVKSMLFSLLVGVVMAGINLPLAISQEETQTMTMEEEIVGTVASVDLEQSLLVVNQLTNAEEGIYENIAVSVTDATSIEKNNVTINLSDVLTGDTVSVEYTIDEEGKMVASYIIVEVTE